MFTAVHSLSTKHSNLKRQCHENFGVIILGQTTSVFNNWLRGVLPLNFFQIGITPRNLNHVRKIVLVAYNESKSVDETKLGC